MSDKITDQPRFRGVQYQTEVNCMPRDGVQLRVRGKAKSLRQRLAARTQEVELLWIAKIIENQANTEC